MKSLKIKKILHGYKQMLSFMYPASIFRVLTAIVYNFTVLHDLVSGLTPVISWIFKAGPGIRWCSVESL